MTKKPKRVTIVWKEIVEHYAEYICPSCHTHFVGGGPNKCTIRFICDCGQELIVNNFKQSLNK
jgi:predicted RNA-binding Zn-ribbon protein involved in translation (DUF1610 family)